MRIPAFALSALMAPASYAADFNCEDAGAFYYQSALAAKTDQAVAGACAEDFTQPACLAYLGAVMENGDYLDRASGGSITDFLNYLKATCPENLPDDPGKF